MATEEQTDVGVIFASISNGSSWGQRLTISNRIVSKLSFYLKRDGSPGGTLTFLIRAVSGDAILLTKAWGNANDISETPAWYEVTFDTATLLNEEVYLLATSSGGGAGNLINVYKTGSDVKANEFANTRSSGGSYGSQSPDDAPYIYTYGGSTAAPAVTTQAATSVDKTTATGNGNVTNLGEPPATQYGVCWATYTNPTTAEPSTPTATSGRTEEGVPAATGAFTANITVLNPNTLYYCRAYVTNSVGDFYGPTVTFTTLADVPVMTTSNPTELATTTALGNGSIDNNGGSAITQHGVVWDTSADPDTSDSKTEEGATTTIGAFASLMTSLSANTLYHVRTYAINSTGTGYGADVTFTTLIAGTPIVATRFTINVRATTATGVGNILDVGAADVTQHGHVWGTSINPTTGDSKTELGTGAVGAFASDITDLTDGTTYFVRAYATNSFGTSYGNNDIIHPTTVWGATRGHYSVLGAYWVYTDKAGVQRALFGVPF